MQDKIKKFKEQFSEIPESLQKQIYIRLGFSVVFLFLFILVIYLVLDWVAATPFIFLSIFSLVSAWALYDRSVIGNYVVIRGHCIDTSVTFIRKRTKTLFIETAEYVVQIMVKQRLKRIPIGTELEVYVANSTPVYDKDGTKLIYTYLSLDIIRGKKPNNKTV